VRVPRTKDCKCAEIYLFFCFSPLIFSSKSFRNSNALSAATEPSRVVVRISMRAIHVNRKTSIVRSPCKRQDSFHRFFKDSKTAYVIVPSISTILCKNNGQNIRNASHV
jgi:hypothetical protein